MDAGTALFVGLVLGMVVSFVACIRVHFRRVRELEHKFRRMLHEAMAPSAAEPSSRAPVECALGCERASRRLTPCAGRCEGLGP